MPLTPEEPQIHESVQGPRATPATGRAASTPHPVPGPRTAATPRPGRPVPGPRPVPPAQRQHSTSGRPQAAPSENRSAPQLQVIPASAEGALDAADEAVDLLLDAGRAPGDILVLTTVGQHPWATHELTFGEAAYWAQHEAGDDVFFAAAAAADRLKPRPVVIIAVNGPADDAAARALAKGRESAGALLIVCGDPQRINAALGAGV
ncbi:hypothetical protein OHR86_25195 [Streptomyces sp. NBC_00441]|uniref:hypothetical protein n=1 Tax=Streptomyces sp. NBC_00441 TaxID=2975742 RepID=UPI002E2D89DB|nr:hypothetical protein [Streptomyces sp. NBC_00441]